MTVPRLNLEEKIGQMVMGHAFGRFRNVKETEHQQAVELISRHRIGGFKLYHGSALGTVMLVRQLGRHSSLPLLFAADLEQGTGQQIVDAPRFPPAMAIGAAGSATLAAKLGLTIAEEARWVGINTIFGPLLDLHHPADRYFGSRSLASRPEPVGRLARAQIEGIHSAGLLSFVKYFPGHGRQQILKDGSSLIRADRAELSAIDMMPFSAAFNAAADGVIVGPGAFPALDHTTWPSIAGTVPAMLSRPIVTGLLRDQLGFKGVICTDALNLPFLRAAAPARSLATQAVVAGADLLVALATPDDAIAAVNGIHDALEAGLIDEQGIDSSVGRIIDLKSRLSHSGLPSASLDDDRALGSADTLRLIEEIGRRSVCLLHAPPDGFPLRRRPLDLWVILIDRDRTDNMPEPDRWRPWHSFSPPAGVSVHSVSMTPGRDRAPEFRKEVRRPEVVVALAQGDDLAVKAMRQCIHALQEQGARPILVLAVDPYLAVELAHLSWAAVWTPDLREASRGATLQALLGEFTMTGRLPI